MRSPARDTAEVLFTALFLAQAEGAEEVSIHHLLTALDADSVTVELMRHAAGPFQPVPKQELPLSPRAAEAISALGEDPLGAPLERLRGVLLAARDEGPA